MVSVRRHYPMGSQTPFGALTGGAPERRMVRFIKTGFDSRLGLSNSSMAKTVDDQDGEAQWRSARSAMASRASLHAAGRLSALWNCSSSD